MYGRLTCVARLLGNAFTVLRHRGRGGQSALFAHRLRDATTLGLSWVVTDVEPATTRRRNAERAGMRIAAYHTWWVASRTLGATG